MTRPPALIDARIPGTRQVGKLLLVTTLVAVFAIGSGDWIISAIVLAGGLWLVTNDVFSVFGWEHIVLTHETLRLERRLFGRALKVVEIERADLESITVTPRPDGIWRLGEDEDRDQDVWAFTTGPIVVETSSAIYHLGQGYIKDRDAAQALVDEIDRELAGA